MIKYNNKDITPKFNNEDVSRIMFNDKQIYPSSSGIDPADANNGVYIYDSTGLLWNLEDWDVANNDNAVGVAVITDNTRMYITKGTKPQRAWSLDLYGTDVPGVTNISSSASDYNGQSNTSAIRAAATSESVSNNAAHYCYSQTASINGSAVHGYLPAIGELRDAYNNKSTVDSAMSLIGGTAMPTDYYIWSSSEDSGGPEGYAWSLYWSNGGTFNRTKDYSDPRVVPCFPLQVLQDLSGLPAPEGSADYGTSTITFEKAPILGVAGAIKLTSDQDWMIRLNPEFPILQSGTYEFCYLDPSNPNNHGQITNQAIILPVTPTN